MPHEGNNVDLGVIPGSAEQKEKASRFNFTELIAALDIWAEFIIDSPVAHVIKGRLRSDVLEAYTRVAWPHDVVNNLTKFATAVYAGGFNAGKRSVDYVSKPFKAWEVWETTNEFGRHGAMIGLFTDEADAKRFAEGKGWFGSNGSVVGGQAVTIGDTIYLIREMINKDDLNISLPEKAKLRREQALAKLTDEDKRILGITE